MSAYSLAGFASDLKARDRMLALEQTRLKNLQAIVETGENDLADFQAAIMLARACIQEQSASKAHVERIVTALLNGVMRGVHDWYALEGEAPEYEFLLEAQEDESGTVTGLKPTIVKNGVADDPKNYGGGVQNLASFALRLIYVLLNPSLSQVVVLDEPMTNLSPKAWRFVVMFLEDLQRDLGLQVIAITHSGARFPSTWVVWREGQTSYVRRDSTED